MVHDAYAQSQELAPNIYERVVPLPTNLVRPLAPFLAEPTPETPAS